jgi:Na+-driven multidrug efflux pump
MQFYDVLLGNNNAIIVNTKYYRTVYYFGLATVILNDCFKRYFILIYGIEGSAFATLITIALFTILLNWCML